MDAKSTTSDTNLESQNIKHFHYIFGFHYIPPHFSILLLKIIYLLCENSHDESQMPKYRRYNAFVLYASSTHEHTHTYTHTNNLMTDTSIYGSIENSCLIG